MTMNKKPARPAPKKAAAPARSNGARNGGGQQEYDNTNRLTIFKSKTATPQNRQPTYWGKLDVEGQEYRISLWPQVGKQSGEKFLAGKIELPFDGRSDADDSGFADADADPFDS